MDFAHYSPAPAVLEQLKAFDFVAIVGPSAGGKTTAVKAAVMIEPRLYAVVGDTSREPRPGEHQGQEYFFCSHDDMARRAERRAYINVALGLHGHLYALNADRFQKSKVNIFPIWAKDIPYFQALPFRSFRVVYLLPPHYEEWLARFNQRQFPADEAHRRRTEIKFSLAFALEVEDLHFIIDETIAVAREDLITLALGQPLSERLQADQSRARGVAQELLTHF
ncbi:MAG TPA: hypothetical protein VLF91_02340 [Candidatus Saccharimonadales bacterium]|nr:hypothetical protein [Candidatus Saccharimonadales bacterium]